MRRIAVTIAACLVLAACGAVEQQEITSTINPVVEFSNIVKPAFADAYPGEDLENAYALMLVYVWCPYVWAAQDGQIPDGDRGEWLVRQMKEGETATGIPLHVQRAFVDAALEIAQSGQDDVAATSCNSIRQQ